jgi:hypothetical protein
MEPFSVIQRSQIPSVISTLRRMDRSGGQMGFSVGNWIETKAERGPSASVHRVSEDGFVVVYLCRVGQRDGVKWAKDWMR